MESSYLIGTEFSIGQSNDCPQEAYNTQQKIYYEHKYNAESMDEMREKK